MLALAGMPLGATFSFFDKSQGTPTLGLGAFTAGDFSDIAALTKFSQECDVITYEFENVPSTAALHLAKSIPVYPPPRALDVSQERVAEKTFISSLGLLTPRFESAKSPSELEGAISRIGSPCIVKTCRMGYDGKGQERITSSSDAAQLWQRLGGVPLIVEEMISFSRELSIIGARNASGEFAIYPLFENKHRDGILRRTEFPAPRITLELQKKAGQIITTTLSALGYVGVVAIELFERDGELLVNEMAPRVHNSGHITQDVSVTSQFENHIRAVMGLPLGPTSARCRGIMLNLIGTVPESPLITSRAEAKLHLYNKSAAPGRKLGHINLLDPSVEAESEMTQLLSA
jgi:5-(carboxyamino)imidazole ribonucleotide synthase